MKALVLRELRRLLPYGVAAPLVVLGLVLAAGALGGGTTDLVVLSLFGGVLLHAGLLGVATVAPDTTAGGVAFLARLPLATPRTYAVKLAAASAWLLAGLLPAGVVGAALLPAHRPFALLAGAACVGLAFGAGLLASVVAHRTLPAVLLAPTLALACLLVGQGTSQVLWGIAGSGLLLPTGPGGVVAGPDLFGMANAAGVALVLGSAAALAFVRGERQQRSARPALVGLGAMAVGLTALVGTAGAADAWTAARAVASLPTGPTLGVASPGGGRLAVPLLGATWAGLEERVAVVDAEGAAWVLPVRHVASPQFSPDGRRLLVSSTREPGGWLVDLETRELEPLAGPEESKEGFGFSDAIWGTRLDGPVLVRAASDRVEGFAPRYADLLERGLARYRLPAGAEYVGVSRGRVVIREAGGLTALPPPELGLDTGAADRVHEAPRGQALARWGAQRAAREALLSPSGRLALVTFADAPRAVHVYDLEEGGRRAILDAGSGHALILGPTQVSWAPGEERVALALAEGGVTFFALDGPRLVTVEAEPKRSSASSDAPRVQPSPAGPAVWSPDGLRAVTDRGVLVDLRAGTASFCPAGPVAGFVGADAWVPWGRPLAAWSLDGRLRAALLEGGE